MVDQRPDFPLFANNIFVEKLSGINSFSIILAARLPFNFCIFADNRFYKKIKRG
jgi:hypothetical protein